MKHGGLLLYQKICILCQSKSQMFLAWSLWKRLWHSVLPLKQCRPMLSWRLIKLRDNPPSMWLNDELVLDEKQTRWDIKDSLWRSGLQAGQENGSSFTTRSWSRSIAGHVPLFLVWPRSHISSRWLRSSALESVMQHTAGSDVREGHSRYRSVWEHQEFSSVLYYWHSNLQSEDGLLGLTSTVKVTEQSLEKLRKSSIIITIFS